VSTPHLPTWPTPTWQPSNQWHHWLPHLWLPLLVFISLWLLVKIPLPTEINQPTLHLELQQQTPAANKEDINQQSVELNKPLPTPKVIDTIKTIESTPQPVATQTPKISAVTEKPATAKPSKTTITVGELLNQAQTIPDLSVTDEFKARGDNTFKTPEIKVHNAYANIPYLPLDEPYAMDLDFYDTGIEGDIQRFFDKVILKKSFTTKYGTKIDCALAVVVLCSWK